MVVLVMNNWLVVVVVVRKMKMKRIIKRHSNQF